MSWTKTTKFDIQLSNVDFVDMANDSITSIYDADQYNLLNELSSITDRTEHDVQLERLSCYQDSTHGNSAQVTYRDDEATHGLYSFAWCIQKRILWSQLDIQLLRVAKQI